MTKLLNIDSNAKTVKGQKRGYMTAVMYLAPFKAAGINVCPMAEMAGCSAACLNTAGRGGIAKGRATMAPYGVELPDNAIQAARIWRTRFYADDRAGFMNQLAKEIQAFIRKAERASLIPVVRLNGTSDIRWEIQDVTVNGQTIEGRTIFDLFPDVQFYDYTKIPNRFRRQLPANYALSLSYSGASERYAGLCEEAQATYDASLVMVARDAEAKERYLQQAKEAGREAVDGDEHDLRFLDGPGSIVVLKAKGAARKDTTGFVLD